MKTGFSKAELDELKRRLNTITRRKLESFKKQNPCPEIPEEIQQRIDREQAEWNDRLDAVESTLEAAADQFFERIVYDHENAMLLLEDFRKL